MEIRHTRNDTVEADAVRMEHRATAVSREPVAVGVDDVDVPRAQRQAFVQDLGALVDQRIQRAVEDLGAEVAAPLANGRMKPLAAE